MWAKKITGRIEGATSILMMALVVATIFPAALTKAEDLSAKTSPDLTAYDITVSATMASDYIFRGVSQTLEDPTVQASFDVSHLSGFSAGIWSSNVDLQDRGPTDDQADQEIDLYIGYGAELNSDWSVDGTVIRYVFPGTASDSDLDWNELLLGAHFRDSISLLIGYSNKVFNIDETGIYYGLSGNYPLTDSILLTASVGHYDLDDALNESYTDWSLGSEMAMGIFTARLAYVDTDNNGEDLFGDNASSRVVFGISAALGQ